MQKRKYIAEVNLKVIREFLLKYWLTSPGRYNTQSSLYRAIEIIKFPWLCENIDFHPLYQLASREYRKSISPENVSRNVYAPNNYFPIVDFLLKHKLFTKVPIRTPNNIQYIPTDLLNNLFENSFDEFTQWVEDKLQQERALRKRSKTKNTDMRKVPTTYHRGAWPLPTESVTLSKDFVIEAHKYACMEWKAKIEAEVPELFEATYKVGDRFILRKNMDDVYMLVRINNNVVSLICLADGNRWSACTTVDNDIKITKEEFGKIVSTDYSHAEAFTKISK
jgi:hypothetical protein